MFNWDNVPQELVKNLKSYCSELVKINNDNLLSINLIKEIDFCKNKKMPIKLVVIVQNMTLDVLKQNLKVVRSGVRKSIPAPLFFTLKHIESSSDVFPIEFYNMGERHVTIYGEDLLSDIKIDNTNIKGKLIRLQQVYLEVGLKEKEIKQLIYSSFQAFISVFRGMLKLKQVPVPSGTLELLQDLSLEYTINIDLLKSIYSLEIDSLKKNKLEEFLSSYINLIRTIAVKVDEMVV